LTMTLMEMVPSATRPIEVGSSGIATEEGSSRAPTKMYSSSLLALKPPSLVQFQVTATLFRHNTILYQSNRPFSGISDRFRYRRLYLPRYSDFKISAISSGDSLQPSASHILIMVFRPLRKNSMWYFMFRSICSFSARLGSYREILCFSS